MLTTEEEKKIEEMMNIEAIEKIKRINSLVKLLDNIDKEYSESINLKQVFPESTIQDLRMRAVSNELSLFKIYQLSIELKNLLK